MRARAPAAVSCVQCVFKHGTSVRPRKEKHATQRSAAQPSLSPTHRQCGSGGVGRGAWGPGQSQMTQKKMLALRQQAKAQKQGRRGEGPREGSNTPATPVLSPDMGNRGRKPWGDFSQPVCPLLLLFGFGKNDEYRS